MNIHSVDILLSGPLILPGFVHVFCLDSSGIKESEITQGKDKQIPYFVALLFHVPDGVCLFMSRYSLSNCVCYDVKNSFRFFRKLSIGK